MHTLFVTLIHGLVLILLVLACVQFKLNYVPYTCDSVDHGPSFLWMKPGNAPRVPYSRMQPHAPTDVWYTLKATCILSEF